jgi:hypothetical protein
MQSHSVNNNKKGRKQCPRPKSREETPKEGCGTPKRHRIKNIFRIAIRLKGQIVAAPCVLPCLNPDRFLSPRLHDVAWRFREPSLTHNSCFSLSFLVAVKRPP